MSGHFASMMGMAGIRSLAVGLPERVITNDWWRARVPEQIAEAEAHSLGRLWRASDEPQSETAIFDAAMAPHLADPFRGTLERRWLDPHERTLDHEVRVAQQALAAAGRTIDEVDMILCGSFVPDQLRVGNGAFLGRALAAQCPAINIESACATGMVGLQMANAMVRSGEAKRVLLVLSCHYSRALDQLDSLSWFLGDGAAAMLIEAIDESTPGAAMLGFHTIHTQATCDAIVSEFGTHEGQPRIVVRSRPAANKSMRENSLPYLRTCVEGALAKSGARLEDVDFFAFNTPIAWFTDFATAALGVDPSRTLSNYPITANIGPALMPSNLHSAAREGRVRPGDLVLAYAVGSVSTASAALFRWGEVGLGPSWGPGRREAP